MNQRESGHVKWFDNAKGYGFIKREDGQDVFVHFGEIIGDGYKTLNEGQTVEYTLQKGDKGFHAVEVSKVD